MSLPHDNKINCKNPEERREEVLVEYGAFSSPTDSSHSSLDASCLPTNARVESKIVPWENKAYFEITNVTMIKKKNVRDNVC
jgi:hypothetical protein